MRELVVIIIVLFFVLLSTGRSQDVDTSDSEFRDARVAQMMGFDTRMVKGGWRILVVFDDDGLLPDKMILTVSQNRYGRLTIGDKIKVYCGPKSTGRD